VLRSWSPRSVADWRRAVVPCVYIAGPYRGSEAQVAANIWSARLAAIYVWTHGGRAFTPHLNTGLMGGIVADNDFLVADLQWLASCDAVLTCGNWEDSQGAAFEVQTARELGLPVFHEQKACGEWIIDRIAMGGGGA
jgi:hypothetical protein